MIGKNKLSFQNGPFLPIRKKKATFPGKRDSDLGSVRSKLLGSQSWEEQWLTPIPGSPVDQTKNAYKIIYAKNFLLSFWQSLVGLDFLSIIKQIGGSSRQRLG